MSTPFVPPTLSFWASHLALSCATVNASRPVFGDAFLLFAAGEHAQGRFEGHDHPVYGCLRAYQ